MLHYLSIGLFLMQTQPIKIWPNGASILINQLTTVIYLPSITIEQLQLYKEVVALHMYDSELAYPEFLYYTKLIENRISTLKKAYDL